MIAPLIAMQQSSIATSNMATAQMMMGSNAMLSGISFGNSQPLKPSFSAQQCDMFELQNKANETKLAVSNSLYDSIIKAIAKNIHRSTPNYGGLNLKA